MKTRTFLLFFLYLLGESSVRSAKKAESEKKEKATKEKKVETKEKTTKKEVIEKVKITLGQDDILCKKKLLEAFDLKGRQLATKQRSLTCKFIDYNCCTPEDELVIFKRWRERDEERDLKARFSYYKKVYKEFLTQVGSVYEFARRIHQRTPKDNNCKLLAKKILAFDINAFAMKMNEVLEDVFRFFVNAYKGFYCTICDGKS